MAYTADELRTTIGKLEAALMRGERSVTFADRSVTYKDAGEITASIAYFKSLLAETSTKRSRQTLGVAVKGF